MRTLYLCGAGNPEGVRLTLSVMRARADAPLWDRVLILDDAPGKHGAVILGVPVAGSFDLLAQADRERDAVVNLVARSATGRALVRERLSRFGLPFAPLVHPDVDTFGVSMGCDIVVYRGATLCAGSTLGEGCCVFTGAVVGHGARLGECCVLAPNAVVNARGVLGSAVYIGSNATLLPELTLGDGATVGAGSSLVDDLAPGSTAIGVPAETLAAREYSAPAASGSTWIDRVTEAWTTVLGRGDFGLDERFFDVGGGSLMAIRVHGYLRNEWRANLAVTDLYCFPTIRMLAERLAGQAGPDMSAPESRASFRRAALQRRLRRTSHATPAAS